MKVIGYVPNRFRYPKICHLVKSEAAAWIESKETLAKPAEDAWDAYKNILEYFEV